MNETTIGIISLGCLIVLLMTGLPISSIFLVLSLVGLSLILSFQNATGLVGAALYFNVASPNWAALPLFILLGSLATHGGYAQKAFKGLNIITKGLTGALGIATCYSCAFFGAMSGSPAATAAIFAKLTLPEMRKYGYEKSFAAGIVACAGTFAAMIPPSGLMIVYALFTQQSIGRLFAGGIVPGFITATVYAILIIIRIKINPKLVREELYQAESHSVWARIKAIKELWPAFLTATVVLGGIYSGVFTPTEAAAAGCALMFILGILQGSLRNLNTVKSALRESSSTASMIFFIIITALFFSRYLAFTEIPIGLANWIAQLQVERIYVLIGILSVWFFLGMIMIPDGIYALCLPIFFPLIVKMGYDPIWFGIITIKLNEIANVTPPVGLNIFTIQSAMGKDITAEEMYVGVWPFVCCDIVVLILLMVFPGIVLWLPNLLLGR
ncbi:MAG: TRAP transporter large permease [Deltaproteobacteria bacterium]|nr:TRAP transporter large permease [Deltaproteobacteria bacterium]MBW1960353.1 TRAP transporter large permease [Deltaproteobacteria bacterium]MBW2152726.1 TRAP transporter large permease [Deltaproteobacteria bacterium]